MYSAEDVVGNRIKASSALRGRDYFCPRCRERLTLILGSAHMQDHFRHSKDSQCIDALHPGESDAHKEKKGEIYQLLSSRIGVSNVQTEYTLRDGQRPDVYFETDRGHGVAVEIQHSPVTDRELADRVASYSSKGVASLWMVDNVKWFLNTIDISDPHRLSRIPAWVRRISSMTDRAVYDYYTDGSGVVCVRLKIEERIERTQDGTPVLTQWWPQTRCDLATGDVRIDVDEHGYQRRLWIPLTFGSRILVKTQGVRAMRRREESTTIYEHVECDRPVRKSTFHDALVKFWDECGLSFDERMKMMGFK